MERLFFVAALVAVLYLSTAVAADLMLVLNRHFSIPPLLQPPIPGFPLRLLGSDWHSSGFPGLLCGSLIVLQGQGTVQDVDFEAVQMQEWQLGCRSIHEVPIGTWTVHLTLLRPDTCLVVAVWTGEHSAGPDWASRPHSPRSPGQLGAFQT